LCHLGQEDFFDHGIRPVVPFGLSSHAPHEAQRAVAENPAYIAIGPVYATGTKPGAKPVTLDYVRWATVNLKLPWFAIGGITLENIDEVLRAGARSVCVVSAILNAQDVRGACQAFAERVRSAA
jgi:thiamine-phosphate pyrophosphorylase